MPFFSNGIGLSFCALLESVCGTAASGLKVRYGPFVSFKNIFKFSKWIFKDYKIFENFKNYESYENYKIYEGSYVV